MCVCAEAGTGDSLQQKWSPKGIQKTNQNRTQRDPKRAKEPSNKSLAEQAWTTDEKGGPRRWLWDPFWIEINTYTVLFLKNCPAKMNK